MQSEPDVDDALRAMLETRGWYSPAHEYLARHDPVFLARYNEFNGRLLHAGVADSDESDLALSVMHRQVMVAVLMAARGLDTARVARHVVKAFELGASERLVMEAMEVAMVVMGSPALHIGLEALIEASGRGRPSAHE